MAQTYKTGLIITGDASGGIRAIKATEDELGKLNQRFDRGARQSKQFGADASRAGQQLRDIDTGANEASQGLEVLRSNVVGVAAAMVTAFGANSIIQQAHLIADTDSLAQSIGVATGELQAWDYAAQQAGLAQGQMGDILKDVTERIGEFTAEGTGEAAALFENLNLNIEEMKRLSPDQQLLRIAEAISTLETRGEKISYLERLGNDATRLLPLLDNNAALLREYTNEAQALGVAMSQVDIENAVQANRAMAQLSGTMDGFKNQISADLGPGLAEAVGGLTEFIQGMGGASVIIDRVTDGAAVLAALMAGRYAAAFATSATKITANIAATYAQAQADVAATAAAKAKAAETLRAALSEQAAAKRAAENARAIAAATGNTSLRTKAISQMAAANQRAIGAEAAHTAAVNANSAAMARSTVAAQGMAVATRAGAGALALVGGPLGAAVLAGSAIYYFREELGLVAPKVQSATDRVDDMTSALDANSEAALKNARAMLEAERQFQQFQQARLAMEVNRQQQVVADEQEQWDSVGGQQAFGMGMRSEAQQKLHDLRLELLDTRQAIEAAGGSVAEIDEKLEELERTTRDIIPPTTELGDATSTSAAAARDAANANNTLGDAYQSLLDRITPNRREARQYAQDLGTLNLAYATGSINAVQYMQQMGRLQESFQASQRETGNVVKEVTEQNNQAAQDLGFAFESAFENAILQGEALRSVLGGIAQDIARITLRQTVTAPIGNWVSGAVGGLFGGSTVAAGSAGAYSSSGFIGQIGFSEGGYTGAGGRLEPAGIVHRGEFVVQKSVVERPGVRPMLEALNQGVAAQFANGGYVVPDSPPAIPTLGLSQGYADGGYVSSPGPVSLERFNQNNHTTQQNVSFSVSVPVTVHAAPGMNQEQAQQQGQAIGQSVEGAVVRVLQKQMRPGGLLYRK